MKEVPLERERASNFLERRWSDPSPYILRHLNRQPSSPLTTNNLHNHRFCMNRHLKPPGFIFLSYTFFINITLLILTLSFLTIEKLLSFYLNIFISKLMTVIINLEQPINTCRKLIKNQNYDPKIYYFF